MATGRIRTFTPSLSLEVQAPRTIAAPDLVATTAESDPVASSISQSSPDLLPNNSSMLPEGPTSRSITGRSAQAQAKFR